MMSVNSAEIVRPNGSAAAALLAAGIGAFALGVLIVTSEASPALKAWLNFYDPVGPLSGKTIIAVSIYAISWVVLHLAVGAKNVRLGVWISWTLVLVGLSLVFTFPPFYELFTRH